MMFKKLQHIEKDEFLKQWEYSERKRKKHDQNAWDRLSVHKAKNNKYSLIQLFEESLSKIILPKHNHFFRISSDLTSLTDFADKYDWDLLNQNPSEECAISISFQIKRFEQQINKSQNFLKRDFIYVSSHPELALNDQKKVNGFLYGGGFHQLAAYALITSHLGFYPLQLFLCEPK